MKKQQLSMLAIVLISLGALLGLFLQLGSSIPGAPDEVLAAAPDDAPLHGCAAGCRSE